MGKKKTAPVPIPVGTPAKPYTTPEIYADLPRWQVETDLATGDGLIVSRGAVIGRFADEGEAEEFVEAMLFKDKMDDARDLALGIGYTADAIKDSLETIENELKIATDRVKALSEEVDSLLEKLP